MSSTFKVPLSDIKDILPHPNADRLDIAVVYGFHVVTQKGLYSVGDRVIFVPPDSILPPELEAILFPADSKIKLTKSRVRQIKIRSYASQGMLIKPSLVGFPYPEEMELETDLSSDLKIVKYEPPVPEFQSTPAGKKRKRNPHPLFYKYNGIENIKWYPDLFKDDEDVVIQEKLHGSNIRFGILPFEPSSIIGKILKFLKFTPQYEKIYGSNEVQISGKLFYRGFYGTDVYGAVLKKLNAFSKVRPGEIVYGELIGEGIQKNYDYGHKGHHVVIFDVRVLKDDGTFVWLNPEEVEEYASDRGFDFVPVLYKGKFNKEHAYSLTRGNSVYDPEQKVREGIVIKSRYKYNDLFCSANKRCVKWLSEEYLSKDQTEFH